MTRNSNEAERNVVDGVLRLLASQALFPISALIIAAFLSRRLGTDGYGLLGLATALVVWTEWTLITLFSRATVKFVREATDWNAVATSVIQFQLCAGATLTATFFLLADTFAAQLGQPELAAYLKLLALDIPIFAVVHAHEHILVGRGKFRAQATIGVTRWCTRTVLVIGLTYLFSIYGALAGMVLSSLVELGVARLYIRPPVFARSSFRLRQMLGYVAPLFIFALSQRLLDRVEIIILKGLGGTVEDAGLYNAAQNLALLPGLFAFSLAPVLLSGLTGLITEGDPAGARRMGRQGMRAVLLILPLVTLVAAASPGIVQFIFGPEFTDAAPILRILILAAAGKLLLTVTSVILISAGKPSWCAVLGLAMVAAAVTLHLLLIPRFGRMGAATATALASGLGAALSIIAVQRSWGILPPVGTLTRSALASIIVAALALQWPVTGFWVILQALGLVLLAAVLLCVTREFSSTDVALLRSLLPLKEPAEKSSC